MAILPSLTALWRFRSRSDDQPKADQRERDYADRAPWLEPVLERHRQITAAFSAVSQAKPGKARQTALRHLHALLSAHAQGEGGGSGQTNMAARDRRKTS